MSQNHAKKICECGGQRVKILPNGSHVCRECLRSVATWRPLNQWLAQKECLCGNTEVYWRAIRREWACTVCYERFGNFKPRSKRTRKLDPALFIKARKDAGVKLWLRLQKKFVWIYLIAFIGFALLVTLYRPAPGSDWQRTPEITLQNLLYGMPWSVAMMLFFTMVVTLNLKVYADIRREYSHFRPKHLLNAMDASDHIE
jgi:hypothetical protein